MLTHALSDGVGQTGTFICIHAQLERLKTEGVVDIFQFIKSARIQRAGLVSDIVSPLIINFIYHYNQLTIDDNYTALQLHTHSNSTCSVTALWPTILMDLIHTPTSKNLSNIIIQHH